MAEPTTATPTALALLKLQLDSEQLTLLTAGGQAAGQAPTTGAGTVFLPSSASPATIRQEIEARAVQDISPWKAIGDRLHMVFVPRFREKGLIFEPVVKTQAGSMLDTCKQLGQNGKYIVAGNASFFGYVEGVTTPEIMGGLDPSRVVVTGRVVKNGQTIAGGSSPSRVAIQYESGLLRTYNGDPPGASTPGVNAIGGLLPVIIAGQKFVPAVPETSWADKKYNDQNRPFVGKSLVGYHSGWDMAVAIWQRDSQWSNGADFLTTSLGYFTLDVTRDFLFDLGFDHVVGMDGSSSVFLYVYATKIEYHAIALTEWPFKDSTIVVAYAIRRP